MRNEQDLLNNKFYIMTNYITDFLMTNLWFLILISPFILYTFIFTGEKSKSVIYILSLTIGPALSTLFSVMGKLIREKSISSTKDFFHFYKINFFQGLLLGIIFNGLISIIYYDIVYFISIGNKICLYIMLGLLLVIVLIGIYAYPIMSRYNVRILYLIRLSMELLVKKIYISITCLAITIITLWFIRFSKISLIGLLFGASIICYFILKIQRSIIDELQEEINKKYQNF